MAANQSEQPNLDMLSTVAKTLARAPRHVSRKFPVGLYVEYRPKTSGAITGTYHGQIMSKACGKMAAQIRTVWNAQVPVLYKQLVYPHHSVGTAVQVIDEHSTVGKFGDVTYWYDAKVVKVIMNGKELPGYIVNPDNPKEPERAVSGMNVRDIFWKKWTPMETSDGPNGPTYYEKEELKKVKKKKKRRKKKMRKKKRATRRWTTAGRLIRYRLPG